VGASGRELGLRFRVEEGYDLQVTRYDEKGWRATFYTTGMEHSPTSATGTGWERTPWHATQRASGERMRQGSSNTSMSTAVLTTSTRSSGSITSAASWTAVQTRNGFG